jgi:hypothetical protein
VLQQNQDLVSTNWVDLPEAEPTVTTTAMKQERLNELEEKSKSLMAEIERLCQREEEIIKEVAALSENLETLGPKHLPS